MKTICLYFEIHNIINLKRYRCFDIGRDHYYYDDYENERTINDVAERSYDDVFIQRYFDSYVTRESNKFNRKITDYLTGEDAMLESQLIEERIYDIENDMWEY